MKKFLYVIAVLFLIACEKDGPEITYFKKGDGVLPNDSLLGLYNIKFTTEDGKVMQETNPNDLVPLQISIDDTTDRGGLYEVMKQLRKGDSVGFQIEAQELFAKSFNNAPIPDSIPPTSQIQFTVCFVDQMTTQEYIQAQEAKRIARGEKQLVIDNEILDNYLAENGIDAQTTDSGLRYVITKQGRGSIPTSGQVVHVDYTGKLLDGQIFDTSNEELAKEIGTYNARRPYEPYAFPLVTGSVIKGWHIGIGLLKEGSKATLYIPSTLGYGESGSGPLIRPNSILVFDVELVKVED